ncbi:unnamed protein product [Protopolystoma xenopodis]|uniref:Uncharacterized protein n=1 Tax=Protopolystoma xenopodis TaxID=117903 RepID=A0A448XEU4_9PLAT|nr:unnamed protein product [Protopolystoma xenopodis]
MGLTGTYMLTLFPRPQDAGELRLDLPQPCVSSSHSTWGGDNSYSQLTESIKITIHLNAGADVDARDTFGNTPLHYAAEDGDSGLLSLLLHNGAGVDAQVRRSQTYRSVESVEAVAFKRPYSQASSRLLELKIPLEAPSRHAVILPDSKRQG